VNGWCKCKASNDETSKNYHKQSNKVIEPTWPAADTTPSASVAAPLPQKQTIPHTHSSNNKQSKKKPQAK
jgi:hypothetical protein